MTRIGLISDTHGYLDEAIFNHFTKCDEIWHAGDFGSIDIANTITTRSGLPLKGVYGNIDGPDVRNVYPEDLCFHCESVKVLITHIGGYPPKYNARAQSLLRKEGPQLFIAGHSHILKVVYDHEIGSLHINPGAAGKYGWHRVRTIVRFAIDGNNIKDCEVIELGKK